MPAVPAVLQPELMPVMAVGTSGGSIFLINPDTMTLYAKLRWVVLGAGCWVGGSANKGGSCVFHSRTGV